MGQVTFTEAGTPYAAQFQDTYYQDDGLNEARHVFMGGNHLPERLKALKAGETFTVAELGFGTGLNLLAAMEVFQAYAPAGTQLRFMSYEKFPLQKIEIEQALLPFWPEVGQGAQALLSGYSPQPGWQCWEVTKNVTLELYVGDANEGVLTQPTKAHAWFLDGFNPKHNADLWELPLMQQVYEHTASGGTFATYTAAGWVRRNLQSVGFSVKKVRGFGRKREMVVGHRAV